MKRVLLLSCFAVLALGQQTNSPMRNGDRYDMTSHSQYSDGNVTHMSGDVVIETSAIILRADAAEYNESSHEITAHGNVTVQLKQ